MPSVHKHSFAVAGEKGHVRSRLGRTAAARLDERYGHPLRDGPHRPEGTETRLKSVTTARVRCGVFAGVI